jgi:hypothetical protein
MPQEASLHFRGVKCLYCSWPIPISSLVAGAEAEFRNHETKTVKYLKCQVFRLRCAGCGKERPYTITEIVEFQGTPFATPLSILGSASRLNEGLNKKRPTAEI